MNLIDDRRAQVTADFLCNRRSWPLYPKLPMKKIEGNEVKDFGTIIAPAKLTINVDGGSQITFASLREMVAAGWVVD